MTSAPPGPTSDQLFRISAARKEVFSRIGCLYGIGPAGEAVDRGTVAFIQLAERKLLITAHHVIAERKFPNARCVVSLVPPEPIEAPMMNSVVRKAAEFEIVLGHATVWADEGMDIAVLTPPEGLLSSPAARWFDADLCAMATTRTVRTKWKAAYDEGAPLSCEAFGFPNMGHVVNIDQKVDLLSAIPIPAFITAMNPHSSGTIGLCDEISVELDLTPAAASTAPNGDLLSAVAQKLAGGADQREDAFGGYSGGPLVFVAMDGTCIFATITGGGKMFGQSKLIATGFDDAIHAFKLSGL